MATGILLGAVIAVASAVTAGQQHAFEAQQRIAANLAGEEIMGRLLVQPYDDLPAWHHRTEPVGTMTDESGEPLPVAFDGLGRSVDVTTALRAIPGVDVNVRGRELRVRVFDRESRDLADVHTFVPEPQS